jgi:hypothetical protein
VACDDRRGESARLQSRHQEPARAGGRPRRSASPDTAIAAIHRSATAAVKIAVPEAGGSPELQIEAMQMASNFILKASLPHPTLLSRSETPVSLVSTGAAWKSDNAAGFVRIIPPQPNLSGLDVAAAIVGDDAKECKGKFASARNSELVDSDVVFRGMSSCEDSEKSAIAEYFVFPRKAGGFIVFSVLTPTKATGQQIQGPQREELNAGFRKAAYTSITQ